MSATFGERIHLSTVYWTAVETLVLKFVTFIFGYWSLNPCIDLKRINSLIYVELAPKTHVSDEKSPGSRLAKSEKTQFNYVNEYFSEKHNSLSRKSGKKLGFSPINYLGPAEKVRKLWNATWRNEDVLTYFELKAGKQIAAFWLTLSMLN